MENQYAQNFDQQFNNNQNQPVPNATGVLVLGIISIVGCFCYGIVGIACGIIALVLANKGRAAYNANPGMYAPASYNNLKAGRICAIIGLCLSALYIILLAVYFIMFGTIIVNNWDEIMRETRNN